MPVQTHCAAETCRNGALQLWSAVISWSQPRLPPGQGFLPVGADARKRKLVSTNRLYKGCHGIPEAHSTPCQERLDHAFFHKVNCVTDSSYAFRNFRTMSWCLPCTPLSSQRAHICRQWKTGLVHPSSLPDLTLCPCKHCHWLLQGLNRAAENSALAPKLTSAFGWAEASLESCGISVRV